MPAEPGQNSGGAYEEIKRAHRDPREVGGRVFRAGSLRLTGAVSAVCRASRFAEQLNGLL